MRRVLAGLLVAAGAAVAADSVPVPPVLSVEYDPMRVVLVPIGRSVAAVIQLPAGESIRYVVAGQPSDCKRADDQWCVAAPAEGNLIFIRAKPQAKVGNNVEVVSGQRVYSFRLTLTPEGSLLGTQRVVVDLPKPPALPPMAAALPARPSSPVVSDQVVIARRVAAPPEVVNASYSVAVGRDSQDIVPDVVFDDGRFTYLRVPGNREVPAVFFVGADGEESMTNTRMDASGQYVVVDRVARRLRLRLGSQVVAIVNESFDAHGVPPVDGTTVEGVERVVRAGRAAVGSAP
jgi:type IV secretion system protein VirB9